LERIPFGITRKLLQHFGLHAHEGVRAGGAFRLRFVRDVDHARAAGGVVMGKLLHLASTRMNSPAAYSARSCSATRYALARVSAGPSPEPLHLTGVTSAPCSPKRAGRKRVSPTLWRNSCVSLAQGIGSDVSSWPPNSSMAARAKSSNVTMVDA